MARATEFNTPKIKAGIFRSPLKSRSENHPEKTVPRIPSRAFIETMEIASWSEYPFASWRNKTPQPLIA